MDEKWREKIENDVELLKANSNNFNLKQSLIEVKLDSAITSIKELKVVVETLVQAPAKKWEEVTKYLMILIIGTMVGAILSAVMKGVIR